MTIIGSTIDPHRNRSIIKRDIPTLREWLSDKALAQNPGQVNECGMANDFWGRLALKAPLAEVKNVSPLNDPRSIGIGILTFFTEQDSVLWTDLGSIDSSSTFPRSMTEFWARGL